MARPYSPQFLRLLQEADEKQVGVQLARLCVDANIPASYVACALDVTRMTTYSWFRGQDIRKKKRKIVEVLIDFLKRDFESGILPAQSREAAKAYIENLIGEPMIQNPKRSKRKKSVNTETSAEGSL